MFRPIRSKIWKVLTHKGTDWSAGSFIGRVKILGCVGALRETDDTNFLEHNGHSRNLNIYGIYPITNNQAEVFE